MPSELPNAPSAWLAFLAGRGARIAAERVQDFGAPAAELAAARDAAILADLSPNALLAVSGDDATAFLHAQLTNDVQALAPGMAQWNGWCSPKGRLLATFLLARRADGYLLMLPREIAAPIAKRLALFVLRSKVKIRDASGELVAMGIAGAGARAAVAAHFGAAPGAMGSAALGDAVAIALDPQRFVAIAPLADAPALWTALAAGATEAGTAAWDWAMVAAGVPVIVAATQEAFVPQMANFDLVGGVSFKKGCYPGQEIVARTQYRGILKRRMALAHLDAGAGAAPAPGDGVYSPLFGDQAAGEVANAAPAPGGGYDLLVVAQIDSLRDGRLALGAVDGAALEIRSHPAAAAA